MNALDNLMLYKMAKDENKKKPNYVVPGAITAAGLGGIGYGTYAKINY